MTLWIERPYRSASGPSSGLWKELRNIFLSQRNQSSQQLNRISITLLRVRNWTVCSQNQNQWSFCKQSNWNEIFRTKKAVTQWEMSSSLGDICRWTEAIFHQQNRILPKTKSFGKGENNLQEPRSFPSKAEWKNRPRHCTFFVRQKNWCWGLLETLQKSWQHW